MHKGLVALETHWTPPDPIWCIRGEEDQAGHWRPEWPYSAFPWMRVHMAVTTDLLNHALCAWANAVWLTVTYYSNHVKHCFYYYHNSMQLNIKIHSHQQAHNLKGFLVHQVKVPNHGHQAVLCIPTKLKQKYMHDQHPCQYPCPLEPIPSQLF